ncbi:two-component system, OmpR family, sensor histidine kinase RstB [Roseateles sp. YR242]|uniref:ATP-binding protein n=1 Tax=Roseateles sp. YR242 TaxID=1855305 RepID=UPI0008C7D4ED|nr:ATP-binding protein [Roseateles sp. YR242]SEL30307.1 two-component system, OmpR family, sensor histidine kinase RstB [Roseateles sp. YR242]
MAALTLRASLLRMALGLGLAVLALALLVEGLVLVGASEVTDDYVRSFMRGTVDLLVRDLAPLDPPARRDRVQELDAQFDYPVRLIPAEGERLSANQRARLARGEVIVTGFNRRIYAALPGEPDQLLLLGPLDTRRGGELPKELASQLAVAVVLALGVAMLAWWQLRPLWRDLRGLQRAAERLSAGRLDTEMPVLQSRLFAPVVVASRAMLERLATALATQREMTGAVSHELRTPLARLRFAIDALVDEDNGTAREQAVLACERDIDELDSLIDASLTAARMDMGAMQPELISGDLGELLILEAKSLEPLMDGKLLETEVRLPGKISFDPRLVPYALRNGLRNAARHARTRVHLSAWVEAGQLWMAIDDDGEGVAPAMREAAFEPFKRLEKSPRTGTRGFGLGLSIVRHVAQAHGGQARLGEAPRLGGARLLLHWPAGGA